MKPYRIAILVVGYRGDGGLLPTLARIPSALRESIAEIVVFHELRDEASHREALGALRSPEWGDRLRFLRQLRGASYGETQKLGFAYAIEKAFDALILLHADGRYAPESLPEMIAGLRAGKEVVFGGRPRRTARTANRLLGLRMRDVRSGFRGYATSILKRIPFRANSDGADFDIQALIQCRASGATIAEIGVADFVDEGRANCVLAAVAYRLHQLHLIRLPRYWVDRDLRYRLKQSPYSSHGQILSLVPAGAQVWDVGCGRGLLAESLAAQGASVVGLDLLERREISSAVQEYHRIDVEHTMPETKRRFDVIVLADLVEHIRDPQDLLAHLGKFLRPDGRVVLSTGNVAIWFYRLSLLLGRFNYGERGILDDSHVHLYTLQSARSLVEKSGFRIRSVRYTVLPFEVVLESARRSAPVRLLDFVYYRLVRLWPALFAYQIVIEAELATLDYAAGEGVLEVPPTRSVSANRV